MLKSSLSYAGNCITSISHIPISYAAK